MFTVKAVIEARTSESSDEFALYQCDRVRVEQPGVLPVVPGRGANFDVRLLSENNMTIDVLPVGHHIGQYSAVYVMNEQGKTVQRITPGPEIPVAANSMHGGPGSLLGAAVGRG